MASSTDRLRAALIFAVTVAGVGLVRPARAAPNASAAQKLFDDARRAFREGQIDEACEKFEASERLEARSGTQLNLAICHEKQGRLATASTDFAKAASLATSEGHRDRTAFATSRIEELAPRLPHLTLRVSESARARGIALRLDGTNVDAAVFGVEAPADPGPHEIQASLSGCATWSRNVQLSEGSREVVDVSAEQGCSAPSVSDAPPRPIGPKTRESIDNGGGGRIVGFVLGGLGVASAGVGAAFGVRTLTRRSDAESLARGGDAAGAQSANDEARTDAWISDVAIGLGAVQLAVATYLLLTSHGPSAASLSPTPTLGFAVGRAGMTVGGQF
jgi:hypothetical protein